MDDTGNGRWLTYSELASVRGINRASAVKLVQRERWQRSTGNERSRVVRVLVPDEWLSRAKESPPDTASVSAMSREDTGMIVALMARAERAEERTDEANKRADVAVALADHMLAQVAEATTRADRPLCQRSCRPDRIGPFGGTDIKKWLDTDRRTRIGSWRDCCRRRVRRWSRYLARLE
jgi:hypothetical protein